MDPDTIMKAVRELYTPEIFTRSLKESKHSETIYKKLCSRLPVSYTMIRQCCSEIKTAYEEREAQRREAVSAALALEKELYKKSQNSKAIRHIQECQTQKMRLTKKQILKSAQKEIRRLTETQFNKAYKTCKT